MYHHLEYPLKVCLDAQKGFAVFWGTEQVTGDAGFVNSYRLKGGGDVFYSDPSRRTIKDLGSGRWCIDEPIGNTGERFLWFLRFNQSHVINITYELTGSVGRELEELSIGIELKSAYTHWFCQEGTDEAFAAGKTTCGMERFFCLGAKGGNTLPVFWFESLDNAGKGFTHTAFGPDGDTKRLMFDSFKSKPTDKNPDCWFLPRTRIVVSDHEKVIKKFIARNRKRVKTLENEHFFASDQSPNNVRVVLANLPWMKNGTHGVRAGSRWPHLKDRSEDDYLPFPFFLSYANALLKYHCYESYLIDSIAEQENCDQFAGHIKLFAPDLLVVETSTPSLPDDIAVLEKLKHDMRIVLCGPLLLLEDPLFMEKNDFVTYILTGEYEQTLLELVNALERGTGVEGVAGLIYRNANGEVVKNPRRELVDINHLLWPERETLPYFSYCDLVGDIPAPSAQMLSSRGCPFKCTFCLWPQTMFAGRNFRARNSTDVADEMEYLVKVLNFSSVYFDDDTTNIGRERMLELCSNIMRRGLDTVPWAMMARADLMDEVVLEALKSAGLCAVKYGVESTSQHLLDGVNKQMDINKTIVAIKNTKRLGIHIHLTFTLGLPGETAQTLEKTINDAIAFDPFSLQFSINTPYPGTEIYQTLFEKGYIVETDFTKFDGHYNGVVCTKDLSPVQLLEAKDRAYASWQRHLRKKRGFSNNLRAFLLSCRYRGVVAALAIVGSHSRLAARGLWLRFSALVAALKNISKNAAGGVKEKGLFFGLGAFVGGVFALLRSVWRFYRVQRSGVLGSFVRYTDYCRTYSWLRGSVYAVFYVYFRVIAVLLAKCDRMLWPLRDRRATGISIKAARFTKGNLNTRHEFGRGAVIDGGSEYAFAEYEFVVQRTSVYNLYVKYACFAYRPVEIYVDGVLLKKRAMLAGTGGWKKRSAKVFRELAVHLSAGKHTLRIYSCGLLPHIHRFVFRSKDQDMGWFESPGDGFMDGFVRAQVNDVLGWRLSLLIPRVFWRRLRTCVLEQREHALNTRMLAGIRSGTHALCGPEYVAIDLTNRCSNSCVACWMYSPQAKKDGADSAWLGQELDTATLMRLLDELAALGTRLVRFTGGGEPFLHPDFFKLVAYAKLKGFETSVTTSLAGVGFEDLVRLVDTGIDEISVSVWAGNAKTYQATHPGAGKDDFDRIKSMLEKICDSKNSTTRVVVCNVLCRENFSQLESMYGFASSCGVDAVYFTLADPAGFDVPDGQMRRVLLDEALALYEKVGKKPDKGPELVFFKTGIIERLQSADPRQCDAPLFSGMGCTMGWYFCRVLADGTVVPCCKGVKYPMGNITVQGFADIWFDRAYNEFRQKALKLHENAGFFNAMDCFSQCDNLMHNIQLKRLLDSGK